jgi:16S rRNA (guanine527-N7)-methyltransferase
VGGTPLPGPVGGTPLPRHEPLPRGLVEALLQAQLWGFLGAGSLEVHVAHAHGFADAAESVGEEVQDPGAGPWLDLGSGGGIPGLVLAHRWPRREAVLLDSNQRRAQFLAGAVRDQGWGNRVRVVHDRAEVAGRREGLRGAFSLVVARSFGPPPVTAECSAPFLQRGGILVVSEPPGSASVGLDDARWPVEGLAKVGLEGCLIWREEFGYRVLRQNEECPEDFPRRMGVPGKRPLYRVDGDRNGGRPAGSEAPTTS